MRTSRIELAGLTTETLRRAASGESASSVRKWLASEGVEVSLTSVKSFVANRHGGTWRPSTPTVEVIAKAEAIIAAPVIVSKAGVVRDPHDIEEIRAIALQRVQDGTATPGDARTLEVALKCAIAERMIRGGSVD